MQIIKTIFGSTKKVETTNVIAKQNDVVTLPKKGRGRPKGSFLDKTDKGTLVKDHLDKYGSISNTSCIELYNYNRLPCTIHRLRKFGYNIVTKKIMFARINGKRIYNTTYTLN